MFVLLARWCCSSCRMLFLTVCHHISRFVGSMWHHEAILEHQDFGSVLQGRSSDLKNFAIGKTLSFAISLTCALANLLFVIKAWLTSLSSSSSRDDFALEVAIFVVVEKLWIFRHLEFSKKMSFSLFAWRFSIRNSVHTLNNAHHYHIFKLIFLFQHHYVFIKITVIFNCYWNEIFHHTRTALEPCVEGHFISSKNAVSIRSQLFTTPDQNQQWANIDYIHFAHKVRNVNWCSAFAFFPLLTIFGNSRSLQ